MLDISIFTIFVKKVMKNVQLLFIAFVMAFSFNVKAQQSGGGVGIGTDDPTETLDVNGNIRVRNMPEQTFIGDTDRIVLIDESGVAKKTTLRFNEFTVYDQVAETNIDENIEGSYTLANRIKNNIDLGLTIEIEVPANTEAKVIVNYSVPVGLSSTTNPSCADGTLYYYGIRFLKDNTEAQAGSRKFSFLSGIPGVKMVTVSGQFIETVVNNTSDNQTIEYELNGYLEFLAGQSISSACAIRFNMWQPTGQNFNWGRASMSAQVFKFPL